MPLQRTVRRPWSMPKKRIDRRIHIVDLRGGREVERVVAPRVGLSLRGPALDAAMGNVLLLDAVDRDRRRAAGGLDTKMVL